MDPLLIQMLIFLVLMAVGVVLVFGIVFVFFVVTIALFYAVIRAMNPDPDKKLPSPMQDALEFKSRVVKGMDPQVDAWRSAAETLKLDFTELPETWTNYGYCVIEGPYSVQDRSIDVQVSIRSWGNLRFTRTSVQVEPSFHLPDDWGPVLTRSTRQGAAFVEHAPKLTIEAGALVHEAIGVRCVPGEIVEVVDALVALSVGGSAP